MYKSVSQQAPESEIREQYSPPRLKRWGSVAELTKVGKSTRVSDAWPGNAPHDEPGSVNPPGLGRR